ncbi:MAG: SprT-like family protein, partial [Phycisphaerae bacterium]
MEKAGGCIHGIFRGLFLFGFKTVMEKTGHPLCFRLSSTMVRAGGKTLLYARRGPDGKRQFHYEIAIGSRLLFNTFRDIQRPVAVCGLVCSDRLQAMQRIMEHEIIHLTELVRWGQSSCKADRFKGLAQQIFGPGGTTHDLVTAREVAATQHNLKVGVIVKFDYDGQKHVGVVNRIHHRATVLVESEVGMRYSNGKKYQKFYVPLGRLRAA